MTPRSRTLLATTLLTNLIACQSGTAAINSSVGRDTTGTLQSGGLTRSYELHVPAGPSRQPRPLLIALNGRGGTGHQFSDLTNFDALADSQGFIAVYPDGYEKSWADGRGGTPADKAGVDDVAFINRLIEVISDQLEVDPKRIYATGISNGGHMSQRLACALSDRIAAVAVVAATMGERLARGCKPGQPVSMLLMHGTNDPLSPYQGGDEGGDRGVVLSAEATLTQWVKLDTCRPEPTITALPDTANDGTQVNRWVYNGCSGGSEVTFYRIEGGGHAWPGQAAYLQYLPERIIGKVSRDIEATNVIWSFLSRLSR